MKPGNTTADASADQVEAKPKIDLASLNTRKASETPYEFELVHPVTKQGLGQFITVYGRDSEVFQSHLRDSLDEKTRKRVALARRGKDEEPMTYQQRRDEATELMVVATVGFREVEWNGPFEFSPANAFKLYETFDWIRDQVDSAISDIENFIKG